MLRGARWLGPMVLVVGCGDGLDPTSTTGVPPGGKADVYGSDDRRELYEAEPLYREVGRSTVLLVQSSNLFLDGQQQLQLRNFSYSDKIRGELGVPLCESEPFRTQPAPGYCSGFLVAPDLVATAGHCVNISTPCEALRFVFDFAYEQHPGEPDVTAVDREDFYRCDTVVGHLYDREATTLGALVEQELWSDWAVVQLDRPVTGRTPLPVRRAGELDEGRRITAVGHPGGVPTKVTDGRVVDGTHELYFNTDLDIFAGNSGSAAVGADGVVEGIVIRGSGGDSFEVVDGCARARRCPAYDPTAGSQCTGNHAMRTEALRPFLDADHLVQASTELGSSTGAIPDGAGEVVAELVVADPGTIGFATLNVDLSHPFPEDLVIALERDDGRRVELFRRPKLKAAGWSIYSRTTDEFDGQPAAGTWRARVEDREQNVASFQWVSSVELVLGIAAAP